MRSGKPMDEDTKIICALVFYVLGAILTNSYCQIHRHDDWAKNNRADAYIKTVAATLFWPLYWPSKVSLWVMTPPEITAEKQWRGHENG